jgi:hypothetical protein
MAKNPHILRENSALGEHLSIGGKIANLKQLAQIGCETPGAENYPICL